MVLRKRFFDVEVPLTNKTFELQGYTIESLNNKTIKLDLTRQLRGKSVEMLFQVKADKHKAVAEARKLLLLPYFIKRMLRKGTDYVEDSFSAECKDALIRIKPFLITRKKVSRKVRNALRTQAKEWLLDYVKNKTTDDLFSETIGNRIQKPLSLKLKKIYPLALCEIRVIDIEKKKEQEELKITKEKVKSKKEEKIEETKETEEIKEEKPKKEKKAKKTTKKKEEQETEEDK